VVAAVGAAGLVATAACTHSVGTGSAGAPTAGPVTASPSFNTHALCRRMTQLAGQIRGTGSSADKPELAAATGTAARSLEKLAADPGLLSTVHTAHDVPPVIARVTVATDPLINACA
jgi:hypothetical protein